MMGLQDVPRSFRAVEVGDRSLFKQVAERLKFVS